MNIKDLEIAKKVVEGCIKCGKCNPTCPTYREHQDECYAPRGKINLILNNLVDNDFIKSCAICENLVPPCFSACPLNINILKAFD